MPTIYAADNFKIRTKGVLTGTVIGSDLEKAATLFDGENTEGWASSPANCYFGLKFPDG